MKLKAPEGCGGVSWDGINYPVVNGVVEVPDEAQEFLEPGWGFTRITEPELKTENRRPKTGS
jgi:hypothetical protein